MIKLYVTYNFMTHYDSLIYNAVMKLNITQHAV